MTLLGLIWAVAAPLLLLPIAAILVLLLNFTGWSRYRRIAVATGIVVVTVGSFWWKDYREFNEVCKRVGKPQIIARAKADGIFLDSPTANSFGMNYLNQQGFAWMEMRSIYDRNKIERVIREANGKTRTEPADAITARYEVRETFEQPYPHTSVNITRVIDRQTEMVMAQAGTAHFDGGWTKWVLGVYGMRHFPNAMTGRDDFQTYYSLAQRTLR
jgi:hypothetical protein